MASSITAIGSALEHETTLGQFHKLVEIDSTHWLLLYQGSGADGFAQVVTVDGSNNVTETGTGLEFDTSDLGGVSAVLLDSNHVLVVWSGPLADGFTQVLTVNLSTWAVTAEGSALEFDTTNCISPKVKMVDSTHALVVYQGTDGDGFATILDVNTSTWAVTDNAAASTEFDTLDFALASNLLNINSDSTRWIVFYRGSGSDGFAQVLTVNTSTWAITATSSLEFDATNGGYNSAIQLDANHFLNTWSGGAGTTGKAQVFTVDLSSWAITANGTALDVDAAATLYQSVALMDSDATNYYCVVAYTGADSDGWMKDLVINKSTWAVTLGGASLEFDTSDATHIDAIEVTTTVVLVAWSGVGADGFIQAFTVNFEFPPTTALNTPADSATGVSATPTLNFTGTDADGDTIEYNVQVDLQTEFDSVLTYANGLELNGSTQYARRNNSSGATNNFTMCFWVKIIAYGGSNTHLYQNGANDARGMSMFITSAGVFQADMAFVANINSTETLSTDTWYHLAWIRNSGTSQLYVNAVAKGSTSASTPNTTSGGDWTTIGAWTSSGGTTSRFSNVVMDDVRFYERAISTGELTTLYGNGNTWPYTDISSTSLKGWWKLDEATGVAPADSSGTGWTLTNTASPSAATGIIASAGNPLLNKLSVTPDTGFTAGHPFASGVAKEFTVQAGDTLANSTVYYWRVRATDPSGSNTYGAWATTRSFTTTSGGGGGTAVKDLISSGLIAFAR